MKESLPSHTKTIMPRFLHFTREHHQCHFADFSQRLAFLLYVRDSWICSVNRISALYHTTHGLYNNTALMPIPFARGIILYSLHLRNAKEESEAEAEAQRSF